ncbi:unnamed protein product [Chondrus crispus]|uniref:Uncharacterized protein n=1 Tax=Chondrus crispus TaxID=2769 RepID=R7QAT4_CHOCR|nr:unnamed protein product [Chondrus crispus]CDF35184.1 unnamed protein product [Chondrus crispus]|eukprot:XP_005715003.1 unnamed protein product [Chondrus crispus]
MVVGLLGHSAGRGVGRVGKGATRDDVGERNGWIDGQG